MKFLTFLLLGISCQLTSAYSAESFSYSGRLVNSDGSPRSGSAQLTFELAYSDDPGVILCTDNLNSVPLVNGVFHVQLKFLSCNLPQVLAQTPAAASISIRVVDTTNTPFKAYAFQTIHPIPYSYVSLWTKQLVQMGASLGQILSWDGSSWMPGSPAGIGPGEITAPMLAPMGATSGQVLKWNGSTWTPQTVVDNGITVEADPTVRGFAKNNLPACSDSQALRFDAALNAGAGGFACQDIILTSDQITPGSGHAYFSVTEGRSAAVSNAVADGVVDVAPSQDAVFDALNLKEDTLNASRDISMKSLALWNGDNSWMGLLVAPASQNFFFTLPAGKGISGQVLKSDGTGKILWSDPTVSDGEIESVHYSKVTGFESGVKATDLAGFDDTPGSVSSSDTVLSALGKIFGSSPRFLLKAGDTMSGDLALGSQRITDLAAPTLDDNPSTRKYLDDLSYWQKMALDISFLTGRVGIGTNAPSSTLSLVNGGQRLHFLTGTNISGYHSTLAAHDDGFNFLNNSTVRGYNFKNSNGTLLRVRSTGELEVTGYALLGDGLKIKSDTSNSIELKTPSALAGNRILTLPAEYGTNGQLLGTDATGKLSWSDISVNASSIAAGSITNSHVAAGAAIEQSKVDGLTSALATINSTIATLKTDDVTEGASNLYFSAPRVLSTPLSGLSSTTGAITSTDTVLSSIAKLTGNASALNLAQSNYVLRSGANSMNGNLNLGTHKILNVIDPVDAQDMATKNYVDTLNTDKFIWSKSGANIYYDGGSVGVGINAPTEKLQVAGNALIESTATSFKVQTSDNTAGMAELQVGQYDWYGFIKYDAATDMLRIDTANNGVPTGTGGIYLSHTSGHIGLGITTLSEVLTVGGATALREMTAPASTSDYGKLYVKPDKKLYFKNDGDVETELGSPNGGTPGNSTVASFQISNGTILDEDLSAAAAIAVTKLGTGLISNAEFNFLAGITSNVQTQIDTTSSSISSLTTSAVPEGTRLYFTEPRVKGTPMSGYLIGPATSVAITDNLLEAVGKLEGQIVANDGELTTLNSKGQWSKTGSDLYYDSGKVGIGTTTPYTKLQIGSVLNATHRLPWMEHGILISKSGDNDQSYIGMKDEGANRQDMVIAFGDDVAESLRFIHDSVGEFERMRLTSSGQLAIGATSPWGSLTMGSYDSHLSFIFAKRPEASVNVGYGDYYNGSDAGGYMAWGVAPNSDKFLLWDSTYGTRMSIDPVKGFVGIGASYPAGVLSIDATHSSKLIKSMAKQAGTHHQSVILLHEIYNGTPVEENHAVGKIFAVRGATTAVHRHGVAEFRTGSTNTSVSGQLTSLSSESSKWKMVTVTYNGKKYLALDVPYSNPEYLGFVFEGLIRSTGAHSLERIDYYNILTATVLNAEVHSSIANFTPVGQEYKDVSLLALSSKMGIGTNSPQAQLEVRGGNAFFGSKAYIYSDSASAITTPAISLAVGNPDTGLNWVSDGILQFTVENSPQMTVRPGGLFGVGTTAPAYKLDVRGGNLNSEGAITNVSDRRMKKEIEPLASSLEKILQLNPVTYFWKNRSVDPSKQVGFIAQDVEQIYPELVRTDSQGHKAMSYFQLVSPLVNALKEFSEKWDHHRERMSELKNKNQILKARNQEILKRLERLERQRSPAVSGH